jgi:hypothetical protein
MNPFRSFLEQKTPRKNTSFIFITFFCAFIIISGIVGFSIARIYFPSQRKTSDTVPQKSQNGDTPIKTQKQDEEKPTLPDESTGSPEIDEEQNLDLMSSTEIASLNIFRDDYYVKTRYFTVGNFTGGKYAGSRIISIIAEEGGMGGNIIKNFLIAETPEKYVFFTRYGEKPFEDSLGTQNKRIVLNSGYLIFPLDPPQFAERGNDNQKITWQKPEEITELQKNTIFSQPQQPWYDVGTIPFGYYPGYDVVITASANSTPFAFPSVTRFLKKGNRWILVSSPTVSIRGDWWTALRYIVDEHYTIKELEFPTNIEAKGMKLKFEYNWINADRYTATFPSGTYDENKYEKSFVDSILGDIFIPKIQSGEANDGRFIAILPDSTELVYSLVIPFTSENNIPEVTWDDGVKNESEYLYQRVNGCGTKDFAHVIGSPDSETVNAQTDLTEAGTTSQGDDIYALSEKKHLLLTTLYEEYETIRKTYAGFEDMKKAPETLTYEQFLAERPVFYWKDPFGRIIEFRKNIFIPVAECGKPVIYLYPEQTTNVHVRVEPKGGMTYSDPPYENGWNVIADPNGRLIEVKSKKQYPYLFWEGRGKRYEQPKKGWSIRQKEVSNFLEEKLSALGLNKQERADFREFWEPRMRTAPYYFITFLGTREMDLLAPLTITPKPDTVIRVLMDFSPLEQPIATQSYKIRTPERRGFTVVEWGGVIN